MDLTGVGVVRHHAAVRLWYLEDIHAKLTFSSLLSFSSEICWGFVLMTVHLCAFSLHDA